MTRIAKKDFFLYHRSILQDSFTFIMFSIICFSIYIKENASTAMLMQEWEGKKPCDCQLHIHAKLPVGTLVVRHSENCAKQSKNDRKRQHLLQDENNMKWFIQYNKLAGLDNFFFFYQINYVSEIPFKIKNY